MTDKTKRRKEDADARNEDPITGAPGAHPVGTVAGAASGAAAGAAVGTMVGGPIGLAAGGVVGAVVGGITGHSVAEAVNPTAEDAYWKENFSTRSYASGAVPYSKYQPAFRYGWEAREKNNGRQWGDVEGSLKADWELSDKATALPWKDARNAAHDAWDHVNR